MNELTRRPPSGGKRPSGSYCVCGHLAKTHTSRHQCTFKSKTGERCACQSIVLAPRLAVAGVRFGVTAAGREALQEVRT